MTCARQSKGPAPADRPDGRAARRSRPAPALLVAALVVLAVGCGDRTPSPGPPTMAPADAGLAPVEGYLLRGNLVEAGTGTPVSRETTYLHFFCDDRGFQASLEPGAGSAYEVRVPGPDVRIRAFDASRAHRPFERTIRLSGPVTAFDVPLEAVPTVLLRGRVVDGATGKPMPFWTDGTVGGNGPLFYVHAGEEQIEALLHADDEGRYSVRVPKAVITFSVVDTAKRLRIATVDLTKAEADEAVFDLVLDG